jgi:hypothetical protein
VLYFNHKNQLVKLAVHLENVDTLSTFGYKMNTLSSYPMVKSGRERWIYINDFKQRSTKSSVEILQIIENSEVQRIISEMRANPQWIKEITLKAERNHMDLEEQLLLDARYIFNKNHPR